MMFKDLCYDKESDIMTVYDKNGLYKFSYKRKDENEVIKIIESALLELKETIKWCVIANGGEESDILNFISKNLKDVREIFYKDYNRSSKDVSELLTIIQLQTSYNHSIISDIVKGWDWNPMHNYFIRKLEGFLMDIKILINFSISLSNLS